MVKISWINSLRMAAYYSYFCFLSSEPVPYQDKRMK